MAETGTRTVERALTLLTAVAQDGGTLSQLARTANLSPSTASRLLATLAGPHLSALAAETGETANLAVAADDRRVVYVRQVAGSRLVQTAGWVGRTIPRRGTALGAALLGEVGDGGWIARTGAVEPDVTSIAAPVYGAGAEISAVVSVLAPTYRMTAGRVEACGRAVARHAAGLSHSLGYFGAAAA